MRSRLIETAALLGLLLAPPLAWALAGDREQPIQIEADGVEIDDRSGVSVYRGNVRYTQGSIEMLADQITVYASERRLTRFVALGRPAKYRQRQEGHEQELRAEAQQIEYVVEPERVTLQGEAHLWREGNEFAGSVIDYQVAQDLVSARKGENGESRVQVIIQPQRDEAAAAPAAPAASAVPDAPAAPAVPDAPAAGP